MIDKTVSYLQDIELLKKIEPIAECMGLEADKKLVKCIDGSLHVVDFDSKAFGLALCDYKTYTSSSLELLLPEWCLHYPENAVYGFRQHRLEVLSKDLQKEISNLLNTWIIRYGKQKVEAIARLIILLDENNILEVK